MGKTLPPEGEGKNPAQALRESSGVSISGGGPAPERPATCSPPGRGGVYPTWAEGARDVTNGCEGLEPR